MISSNLNESTNSSSSTEDVTPLPASSPSPSGHVNITMGVNGHDGYEDYPLDQVEARFKLLDSKNLRSYRGGGDLTNDFSEFDKVVALAKKYNITLRPMIYPRTQADAYAVAKRYGADIKIWEIGNEMDGDPDQAGAIASMVAAYNGIKQASDEMGYNLKTTINVMACNDDLPGRCYGQSGGSMYFLDAAKSAGFNFDYISFHYYAFFGDKGYWMDKFLGQMRAQATKYHTKVFLNEMNCADIYNGTTDGGSPGDQACYDSVKQYLEILNADYKDIVEEINVYELLDEPHHEIEHERHFGLMYDVNHPKKILDLISSFAK